MSVSANIHKSGSIRPLEYRLTDCRDQHCGLNVAIEQKDNFGYIIADIIFMGVTLADCDALIEAGVMAKKALREEK